VSDIFTRSIFIPHTKQLAVYDFAKTPKLTRITFLLNRKFIIDGLEGSRYRVTWCELVTNQMEFIVMIKKAKKSAAKKATKKPAAKKAVKKTAAKKPAAKKKVAKNAVKKTVAKKATKKPAAKKAAKKPAAKKKVGISLLKASSAKKVTPIRL